MKSELRRAVGTAREFTLRLNPNGARNNPWQPAQNQILNDAGMAAARDTIAGWPGYAPTPLYELPAMAQALGISALHYKDEGPRFGLGSFKALGGAYAVARLLQAELSAHLGRPVTMQEVTAKTHADFARQITVCCATDGNHGRSVAWGAQSFGCTCVIFIHAGVSEGRKAAIEAYGAQVRRTKGNYDDSVREAQQTASDLGWFVVSDTSYQGYMDVPKDVMQGYEVMAAEAFDALDIPPTHIFLQTGVGGMAAAVAALAVRRWGADRPQIVLCDPDQSACYLESFRAGAPAVVEGDLDTLMAGLACGEVSSLAWAILNDHSDAVIAVTDAAAVDAMGRLARPAGGDPAIVAGESAVAGLAALTVTRDDAEARSLLALGPSARVLLFGTESDTDPEVYQRLVGMTADQVRGQLDATA